ncbi:MAG: His-Xaa-Ser system protein HxsD [Planctomycetes bacterium GWF2_42_9]|nr:MAG: His-Xaa-Ser system protein HxsD [Planctomycetes bacterium GWF2_42_9]
MEGIIINKDDNSICLQVDEYLYQKEAIQAASHKFIDKNYVKIDRNSVGLISVILRPKENCESENLALEFCNELIDQQVRINIEKSCGNIRDLIVKQAFAPIDNIQDEVKI